MRITVLGAGAIGSLFGGFLAQHDDVTLVCRQGHAQIIQKEGLKISGLSEIHVRPRAVTSVDGLEPPEILFLTAKAYDTVNAVPDIRRLMSPDTILVSLQNGLGNAETLRSAFPDSRLVFGITSQAAILTAPGTVEHTGRSDTIVGGDDAGLIADLLDATGMKTSVSDDIQADIWYKAIVNSAINPVAALLSERNGAIAARPELEGLVKGIISEGVAVAVAKGISLDETEALSRVMKVARDTANNRCSMLTDLEKGRRTEIMQMNGAIARFGTEAGVTVPANALITSLILALESKIGF